MTGVSALRANRNFRRFWSAHVISTLGSAVSAIAIPLLVLTLGGGVARAGLIGTCGLVTRLVSQFPAGQLADRFDRRWLMLSADLIRMIFIGSIPVAAGLDRLVFGQLLLVAMVEGVASAVFSAAAGIAVRDVVADEELTSALGSSQAASSSGMLIGPVIGGFLFGIDRNLPFTVDAVSYLISAVLLLGITVTPPERGPRGGSDRRMTAGLRWLASQPQLLWVLGFAAMINIAGSGVEVGVVITLRDQGESSSAIGIVMACLGAGAVLGAVLAARLITWLATGRLFLLTGTVWAVGFGVLATRPAVAVVGAALLALLVFTPAGVIKLEREVVVQCPREILGRVNMAVSTGLLGLASLGPLLISFAIDHFGVSDAWLILAALTLLAVVLAARPLLRSSSLGVDPGSLRAGSAPVRAGVA
ncbi:MAG TPA: MFS transporter [Jatrophihabitans sp.]|jgi:MFS family permease|nr:MFS transporter [Jatrophihabitans sp.]